MAEYLVSRRVSERHAYLCSHACARRWVCALYAREAGGGGAAGPRGVQDLLSAGLADGNLAPELIACLSPAERSPPFSSDQLLPLQPNRKSRRYPRDKAAPGPGSGSARNPGVRLGGRGRPASRDVSAPCWPPLTRLERDQAPRVVGKEVRPWGHKEPSQSRTRWRVVVQAEGRCAAPHAHSKTLTQIRATPYLSWAPRSYLHYVLPTTVLLGKSSCPRTHSPKIGVDHPLLAFRVVYDLHCGGDGQGNVGRGSPLSLHGPRASNSFLPSPGGRKLFPPPISSQPPEEKRASAPIRMWVPRDTTTATLSPTLLAGGSAPHTQTSAHMHPQKRTDAEPRSYSSGRPHPQLRSPAPQRRFGKRTLTLYTRIPRGRRDTAPQILEAHAGPGVTSGTPA